MFKGSFYPQSTKLTSEMKKISSFYLERQIFIEIATLSIFKVIFGSFGVILKSRDTAGRNARSNFFHRKFINFAI